MKPYLLFRILLLLLGIFCSCKRELSCEGCAGTNKPPIAIAGPDQIITLPTDSISLDGSASNDPDGTISGWLWKKISGPASFVISNVASSKTLVKTLVKGVYQFELKVTDDKNLSATDTLQIVVNDPLQINNPPVANAGPDQTITLPTNAVDLDGSASSDPDNNIMNYTWAKISGPSSFNIANTGSVQTQVTNLVQGAYLFELKVTDAGGLFSKDTIRVTVNAQPPPLQTCGSTNRPVINAQLIPFGTLSLARESMAVASAGNKIVFAGGIGGSFGNPFPTSRIDIYDVVSGTWSTSELCIGRYSIAAAATGNKIFFGGGETGDGTCGVDSVDIYDISTNTWSVSHLSAAGNSITAAAVGNKVLFAGGDPTSCGNGTGVDRAKTVDIYDVTLNQWSTTSLTEPKYNMSAVTLNDRVFFSGGAGSLLSKKIEIYNDATGTWTLDSMYEEKAAHGGIVAGGKIFWAGGGSYSSNPTCLVEIKDVNSGNQSIQYLSQPGYWNADAGQSPVVKDNKIIFIGHSVNNRDKFDIYDIASNTWYIGILPQPVPYGASFFSLNNTIYIAGGTTGSAFTNQVWKLEF